MADGRGVTAKVKWVSKTDLEGRNRWIHCTPLIGSNGVIVDDETSTPPSRRFKIAPPIDPKFGRSTPTYHQKDDSSLRDFALTNGGRETSLNGGQGSIRSNDDIGGSTYSLRID
jgi:hypothetical protein